MKFLHIPKGEGAWAGIFFLLGFTGFIAATAFFVFNILFSAFGLMEMTGGKIIWEFSNPYIPAFIIQSGGKVGLIMAILGGLLASISEGRLWIIPAKNKGNKSVMEKKGLFSLFSMIFVVYDICSSYYFLSSGNLFDSSGGWFSGIMTFIVTMGATILLFSIGPEMFMVWGFETMAENYRDGVPALGGGTGNVIAVIKYILVSIFNAVKGITEWETDDDDQSPKPASKRGRPRLDYNESEQI